jgi:hypothetical protein
MTNKSKPWMKAKTAGEAYTEAFQHAVMYGKCDLIDTVADAVIEWHEAQREKVGEGWEVFFHCEDGSWLMCGRYPDLKSARKRIGGQDEMKVVKVTRYRRKK